MSSPEQRQRILNRRKALLDYKSEMEEAEARGEARGEVKGANMFGALISKLFSLNRLDDAKRCSEDEDYRNKLYAEFGLNKA